MRRLQRVAIRSFSSTMPELADSRMACCSEAASCSASLTARCSVMSSISATMPAVGSARSIARADSLAQ